MRELVQQTEHVVIKIGSAVFLRDQLHVDRPAFASLVEGIDDLLRRGWSVTLVSSGAVAMGRQWLGKAAGPGREIPRLQAYAALGQSRLMEMYETEFSHYGRKVAQILFSRGDLSERPRYLNARQTLATLEELGAVPVINENDTVATEELRFGDNDQLAAMTAGLVGAQTLILLSDVEGLKEVEFGPAGERRLGATVESIEVDDPRIDQWAGPSATGVGTGGMISKVRAARIAARSGATTVIAPGKERRVLQRIADGEAVGTIFDPGNAPTVAGRKIWLGSSALATGKITCDPGAQRAICRQGASLLPSGITAVDGDFEEGSVVELSDEKGRIFARGLTVYGAPDLRAIAGHQSQKIESILGFKVLDAAVHRDNLIIL